MATMRLPLAGARPMRHLRPPALALLASACLAGLAVSLGPGYENAAPSAVTIPLAALGLAFGVAAIVLERSTSSFVSLIGFFSVVLAFIALGLALAGPVWPG